MKTQLMLLAGHSQHGFEVSSPSSSEAGTTSFKRLTNAVLVSHLRDAYDFVMSKETKTTILRQRVEADVSKGGQRYVVFTIGFMKAVVVAPKKGKTRATIMLSLDGLEDE